MPPLAELEAQARLRHLTITAGLDETACENRGDLPPGTRTLLLLSPDEPAFWPAYSQSPEALDTRPDPMDRWSHRVITDWAKDLDATALFPFGGPPFQPFIGWALASGRVHGSPVGMLVHPTAGLFLSFRGALALPWATQVPAPVPRPCDSCAGRPCLTTCPVDALGPDGYDTTACKSFLRQDSGQDCLTGGCLARRACPRGKLHGRVREHSAYHMAQFL